MDDQTQSPIAKQSAQPIQPAPDPSAVVTSQVAATQSYHPQSTPLKESSSMGKREFLVPSEPAESQPEVTEELKEVGVEASEDQEKLKLSVEDQLAGLEHAKESIPAPVFTQTDMQFPHQPFTGQTAVDVLKETKANDSKHWLAVLVLEVLHKIHIVNINKTEEVKESLFQKAARKL